MTLLFAQSCKNRENSNAYTVFDKGNIKSEVKHAVGFDIYKTDNLTKLVIYNPNSLNQILSSWYFTNDNKLDVESNVFNYPLDSFAVFSATQLNAFFVLGSLEKVVAISESDFIRNEKVLKLYEKGHITNLASNGNFYLEKALEVAPKVVFYSPYNLAQKHPLTDTHLTLVPFFDFMETNPLGRAEWIKFTALFTNQSARADSIFNDICNQYNYYKALTDSVEYKPSVFSDKYYNGQWFVPGGNSYIAELFKDAGARYLWKDNDNKASINLDFEVVFDKAHDADFWRIVGHYHNGFSYEKLLSENELYGNFMAFKNRKIVFCDTKLTTYFETGTLEPHILLADLICAFHPDILPQHKPVYYRHYN